MANTKTAKKQILVTKRNHERNLAIKSRLKSTLKRARLAIAAAADATAATDALNLAVKTLYKSATKGIIKKQNASRRVGRLMLSYNRAFDPAKLAAAAEAAAAAPAAKAVKGKAGAKPAAKATTAKTAAPKAAAKTAAPVAEPEVAAAPEAEVEASAPETETEA